ncbi:hypothetical protein [Commensalibacter nepenthis]|uniref:Uncharacterized protein n=1 Tax=Commensalibacter nepenthis TaxID=3043872 RepID=A0ABT6QAC5_9PROT|nr:hypothetical protein [Commensalibacter sp. TBRC 10068]MDI2113854.1 hypothetical protein [Commensalibacter sp. TBRC 10068]
MNFLKGTYRTVKMWLLALKDMGLRLVGRVKIIYRLKMRMAGMLD